MEERAKLETLRNLTIDAAGGRSVPLAQIGTLSYALEPPLIWRRQRLPTSIWPLPVEVPLPITK